MRARGTGSATGWNWWKTNQLPRQRLDVACPNTHVKGEAHPAPER